MDIPSDAIPFKALFGWLLRNDCGIAAGGLWLDIFDRQYTRVTATLKRHEIAAVEQGYTIVTDTLREWAGDIREALQTEDLREAASTALGYICRLAVEWVRTLDIPQQRSMLLDLLLDSLGGDASLLLTVCTPSQQAALQELFREAEITLSAVQCGCTPGHEKK